MVTRSRRNVVLAVCLPFVFGMSVAAQDAASIVEISGRVTDSSGKPVENAVVEAVGTDVSPVLTNVKGTYKFYLVGQEDRFSLRVSKDGYVTDSSQPMAPERKLAFDKVLKRTVARDIRVTMDDFVSGVSISGRVTGLKPEDVDKYKILIYVLTDKWYIHPYAENVERRGYASVKGDGRWTLRSVNRGHNPFKLAILVVPKDVVPPTPITVAEDAEQSLRAKLGANLVASHIMKAPKGL